MRALHVIFTPALFSFGCALVTDLSSLNAGSGDAGPDVADAAADVAPDVAPDAPACTDTTSDGKNCGACGHDCLGGACTKGLCQPVTLISGQGNVGQIAVDAKRVVWSRGRGATETGGLFAVDLDGANPATLFESSAFSCGALAIDDANAYFACTDGVIHRCALGSCSPATLTTASSVRALALDAASSNLYVSIGTPYDQQTGGYIGVAPLAGGSIARVTTSDQPNPGSMMLANGNVYWVDSGTYTTDKFDLNGGVRKAPAATGQTASVLDNDTSGSDYFGLYIDGTTAYYGAGISHEVHAVSLLGGSASKFATNVSSNGEAFSIVGDANYVYWSETTAAGGISRCEKSCIAPVQLVADADAHALTEDATALYWVNGTGEIKRLAK